MKERRTFALAPGVLGVTLLVALLAFAPACHRDIGDQCQTSVDCDPNGMRQCDLSQPGGYCTVVGCDQSSCPDGSLCIRYFPEKYLTTPCNPQCEDACHVDCSAADGGAPDAGCPLVCTGLPDGVTCAASDVGQCAADELCLDVGLCARRALEQRSCAKKCGSNGDCRGGYECRAAGTRGSMLLSTNPGATASFCAPSEP